MSNGVNGLANYLAGIVNYAKQEAKQKGIQKARVSGNSVDIFGRMLPYDVAVDISVKDGDWVYVYITGNKAVVVGR